jgi:hypothetical protein
MNEIQILIRSLYGLVGNKVYMRDLEKLLEEKLVNLTPADRQTLLYLARNLNEHK